jgi:hypothetical protein
MISRVGLVLHLKKIITTTLFKQGAMKKIVHVLGFGVCLGRVMESHDGMKFTKTKYEVIF